MKGLSDIELANRVYALALDVSQFNAFMDIWSDYLDEQLASDEPFVFSKTPLAQHFERASEIMDRMGVRKPAHPTARSLVDRASGPAIVTDERGHLLASNFEIDIGNNSVLSRSLGLPDSEIDALVDWRLDTRADCPDVKLLKARAEGDVEGRSFIASRVTLENGERDHEKGTAGVLIQALAIDVDAELAKTLQHAFGLSEAEADVACGLATGLKPQDIANSRGASLSTVRTQIKKLQGKMDVGGTTDVVRMLCGFAASQNVRADMAVRVISTIDESGDGVRRSRIRLNDGRSLSVAEQGNETGKAILSFHSMFLGPTITPAFSDALEASDWRYIAPSRAGYGTSDPFANVDKMSIDEQVERTCADFKQVMDSLGIEKAVLLGNGAGSVFAHKFAALYPEHTRAVIFVSHAPYWDDRLMVELTKRQRLLAKIARFAPRAQIFLRKVAIALIRTGDRGISTFISGNVDGEPLDQKAVRRPEVLKILKSGMRHALSQSADLYRAEGGLMIRNWPDEMKAISAPIFAITGTGEGSHGQGFTDGYVAAKPSAQAVYVEGAGNYLLYTHWQHVLAVLNRL